MNIKRIIILFFTIEFGTATYAQFNESGISAGFFDSSAEKDINFSEFHLPPMAVLFENAKTNPKIMTLEKARQLADYCTVDQFFAPGVGYVLGPIVQEYYQNGKHAIWVGRIEMELSNK